MFAENREIINFVECGDRCGACVQEQEVPTKHDQTMDQYESPSSIIPLYHCVHGERYFTRSKNEKLLQVI